MLVNKILIASLVGVFSINLYAATKNENNNSEGKVIENRLESNPLKNTPIAQLKKQYMACSDASEKTMLDSSDAFLCSFTHEALLAREFKGNFSDLLAWWKSQKEKSSANQ